MIDLWSDSKDEAENKLIENYEEDISDYKMIENNLTEDEIKKLSKRDHQHSWKYELTYTTLWKYCHKCGKRKWVRDV